MCDDLAAMLKLPDAEAEPEGGPPQLEDDTDTSGAYDRSVFLTESVLVNVVGLPSWIVAPSTLLAPSPAPFPSILILLIYSRSRILSAWSQEMVRCIKKSFLFLTMKLVFSVRE